MDIGDGDLVRLARDGDPAAFRLLVERHLPMARARAARLCPQPDDADDAVQDAFLQAFIALDRLRDPDRFAGWLGGIIANVCRAQRRRVPLTLLGDWPEHLHPASADTLPSAEDLDRADVLSRAVAGLPPGQRHAVTAFYYDDQPTGQIAATPGAGQAGLHLAAGWPGDPPGGPLRDRGGSLTGPGSSDWTWHEVTMPVPGEAAAIRFGISLAGRGRIELRNAELTAARPETQE